MLYLLLDILIYNYSPFKSALFLLNNNKNILYSITIALYIDVFITHTYFLISLYTLIVYILKKYLVSRNFLIYYLYYISASLIFYILFNISYIILINLLSLFIINSLFIILSYKKEKHTYNLMGE